MSSATVASKYWICDQCALEKGLVCNKTGNSKIRARCGHCESKIEDMLTPVIDFRKENNYPSCENCLKPIKGFNEEDFKNQEVFCSLSCSEEYYNLKEDICFGF